MASYSQTKFQALKMYPKELEGDPTISKHINTLYQKMLEQNLSKIVEPYSRVQVRVEKKIFPRDGHVQKFYYNMKERIKLDNYLIKCRMHKSLE